MARRVLHLGAGHALWRASKIIPTAIVEDNSDRDPRAHAIDRGTTRRVEIWMIPSARGLPATPQASCADACVDLGIGVPCDNQRCRAWIMPAKIRGAVYSPARASGTSSLPESPEPRVHCRHFPDLRTCTAPALSWGRRSTVCAIMSMAVDNGAFGISWAPPRCAGGMRDQSWANYGSCFPVPS